MKQNSAPNDAAEVPFKEIGNRTCKNSAWVCPRGAQSRNMCIDRRLQRGYNVIVPGRSLRRERRSRKAGFGV